MYWKQNGKCTCTDVTNHIYIQSCTFLFFLAYSSIPLAIAGTLILFNCLTWYFIMASRARQTTTIMETVLAFPFIRYVWKELKDLIRKDCKDISF